MISIYLNIILYICSIILSIECRQNLRDYVITQNYLSELRRDEFSIYDESVKNLICRLQSSNNVFNRLTNLVSYPSQQTIASIKNVWSTYMYQGYMNVLDDELNRWMPGQIYQRYHPQSLRFTIEYGGQSYTMENKIGSLITEIRNERKPNYLLTRFYQTNIDPILGISRFNIKIYTDDLPDSIYMLAFHALRSTTSKTRIRFIP